jgi:hypothetical protein
VLVSVVDVFESRGSWLFASLTCDNVGAFTCDCRLSVKGNADALDPFSSSPSLFNFTVVVIPSTNYSILGSLITLIVLSVGLLPKVLGGIRHPSSLARGSRENRDTSSYVEMIGMDNISKLIYRA